MKKKHIVGIGFQYFAVDSISAATQLISILSKATEVKRVWDVEWDVEIGRDAKYWEAEDSKKEFTLVADQSVKMPEAKDKSDALRLPQPKRGAILCLCEKSYVAPRDNCVHCGRNFRQNTRIR